VWLGWLGYEDGPSRGGWLVAPSLKHDGPFSIYIRQSKPHHMNDDLFKFVVSPYAHLYRHRSIPFLYHIYRLQLPHISSFFGATYHIVAFTSLAALVSLSKAAEGKDQEVKIEEGAEPCATARLLLNDQEEACKIEIHEAEAANHEFQKAHAAGALPQALALSEDHGIVAQISPEQAAAAEAAVASDKPSLPGQPQNISPEKASASTPDKTPENKGQASASASASEKPSLPETLPDTAENPGHAGAPDSDAENDGGTGEEEGGESEGEKESDPAVQTDKEVEPPPPAPMESPQLAADTKQTLGEGL